MKKTALLVDVSFCTRVIVDENATIDEISKIAKRQIKEKIETDFGDNISSIIADDECPYDPINDK